MPQSYPRAGSNGGATISASLGAVRIAERELLALGEEVGWDALESYAEAWFDYSEGKMIEAIQRLSSGKTVTRAAHDPIPGLPGRHSTVLEGGDRREPAPSRSICVTIQTASPAAST